MRCGLKRAGINRLSVQQFNIFWVGSWCAAQSMPGMHYHLWLSMMAAAACFCHFFCRLLGARPSTQRGVRCLINVVFNPQEDPCQAINTVVGKRFTFALQL
jgi:hypothetical protein